MNDINVGGEAFPVALRDGGVMYGMTLRDYFAAQELSNMDIACVHGADHAYDRIAKHCYKMADAMVRARALTYEELA